MRKDILLGFLLLLTSTIGLVPVNAENGVSDKDGDNIPDNVDDCPHLPEDYEDAIEGCPSEHEIYHDKDLDGIEDHDDMCPSVPEVYNQFQDEDGCPDYAGGVPEGTPDSDGDGIPDASDWCPSQPETYNGILDLDGCPDDNTSNLDSDQDGIPNVYDACPDVKETYNQFEDTDGCPDNVTGDSGGYNFPDADGDGIQDRMDQCIYERENFNNYLDWDGCPDVPGAASTGTPIDSDFDGIYDFEDLCPTERETRNKYIDADGCPDVAPGGLCARLCARRGTSQGPLDRRLRRGRSTSPHRCAGRVGAPARTAPGGAATTNAPCHGWRRTAWSWEHGGDCTAARC